MQGTLTSTMDTWCEKTLTSEQLAAVISELRIDVDADHFLQLYKAGHTSVVLVTEGMLDQQSSNLQWQLDKLGLKFWTHYPAPNALHMRNSYAFLSQEVQAGRLPYSNIHPNDHNAFGDMTDIHWHSSAPVCSPLALLSREVNGRHSCLHRFAADQQRLRKPEELQQQDLEQLSAQQLNNEDQGGEQQDHEQQQIEQQSNEQQDTGQHNEQQQTGQQQVGEQQQEPGPILANAPIAIAAAPSLGVVEWCEVMHVKFVVKMLSATAREDLEAWLQQQQQDGGDNAHQQQQQPGEAGDADGGNNAQQQQQQMGQEVPLQLHLQKAIPGQIERQSQLNPVDQQAIKHRYVFSALVTLKQQQRQQQQEEEWSLLHGSTTPCNTQPGSSSSSSSSSSGGSGISWAPIITIDYPLFERGGEFIIPQGLFDQGVRDWRALHKGDTFTMKWKEGVFEGTVTGYVPRRRDSRYRCSPWQRLKVSWPGWEESESRKAGYDKISPWEAKRPEGYQPLQPVQSQLLPTHAPWTSTAADMAAARAKLKRPLEDEYTSGDESGGYSDDSADLDLDQDLSDNDESASRRRHHSSRRSRGIRRHISSGSRPNRAPRDPDQQPGHNYGREVLGVPDDTCVICRQGVDGGHLISCTAGFSSTRSCNRQYHQGCLLLLNAAGIGVTSSSIKAAAARAAAGLSTVAVGSSTNNLQGYDGLLRQFHHQQQQPQQQQGSSNSPAAVAAVNAVTSALAALQLQSKQQRRRQQQQQQGVLVCCPAHYCHGCDLNGKAENMVWCCCCCVRTYHGKRCVPMAAERVVLGGKEYVRCPYCVAAGESVPAVPAPAAGGHEQDVPEPADVTGATAAVESLSALETAAAGAETQPAMTRVLSSGTGQQAAAAVGLSGAAADDGHKGEGHPTMQPTQVQQAQQQTQQQTQQQAPAAMMLAPSGSATGTQQHQQQQERDDELIDLTWDDEQPSGHTPAAALAVQILMHEGREVIVIDSDSEEIDSMIPSGQPPLDGIGNGDAAAAVPAAAAIPVSPAAPDAVEQRGLHAAAATLATPATSEPADSNMQQQVPPADEQEQEHQPENPSLLMRQLSEGQQQQQQQQQELVKPIPGWLLAALEDPERQNPSYKLVPVTADQQDQAGSSAAAAASTAAAAEAGRALQHAAAALESRLLQPAPALVAAATASEATQQQQQQQCLPLVSCQSHWLMGDISKAEGDHRVPGTKWSPVIGLPGCHGRLYSVCLIAEHGSTAVDADAQVQQQQQADISAGAGSAATAAAAAAAGPAVYLRHSRYSRKCSSKKQRPGAAGIEAAAGSSAVDQGSVAELSVIVNGSVVPAGHKVQLEVGSVIEVQGLKFRLEAV